MLRNLKTVNYWYQTPATTPDTPDTLEWVFMTATAGDGSPTPYFFQHIYIPILQRESNGAPVIGDDGNYVVTYKDIGVSNEELADMYMTLYGYNKLSVPLPRPEIDPDGYTTGRNMAAKKIKSILNLNLYKYLKWIDSMGYAYNPLWNVDGVESFQFIDNHGSVITDSTTTGTTLDTLSTAPYDEVDPKLVNRTDGTSTIGTNSEVSHGDITGTIPQQIQGPVIAITGGDYSHIEKRVRQGNIGVTQTSELIRNERELVKFNLVQEFFRDINKQLLVGTYDGF